MKRLSALFVLMAALPAAAVAAPLPASLRTDLTHYLATRAKAEHISALSLSVWLHGRSRINVTAGSRRPHLDPEDVTRWSRALYVGALLPAKQRRELTTIVSDATGKPIARTTLQDRMGFGLGVGQLTLPGMGTFWYYQGETLGYRMVYAYLPKSDLTMAVGLNSQPPGKQDKVGVLLAAVYATLRAAGKT